MSKYFIHKDEFYSYSSFTPATDRDVLANDYWHEIPDDLVEQWRAARDALVSAEAKIMVVVNRQKAAVAERARQRRLAEQLRRESARRQALSIGLLALKERGQ